MGSEHDHDENKQVSEEPLLEDENRDGEHEKILSEDIVIIHSEIHSRSSSSSSSSSSYSSPPKHLPETDSPPVQVMDRDDNSNYDPDRIPSSVFETSKSNLQADWSCASNESLFSIHIGRNSFTVDAMKSGELYKSGELLAYSPELPMPPPPGKESDPLVESKKVVDSDDDDEKEEQPPAVSWKTPTKSYRSNRSSNSTHSFSFPILAGAASDSASVETGEKKKQEKQSEETKPPAEVENQKNSTMCGCGITVRLSDLFLHEPPLKPLPRVLVVSSLIHICIHICSFWKVSVNQVIIVEPKKLRSNFRREGDERERETPPEICVGTKRFPITAQRNYSCNPAIGGFVLKHEWRNTMWKELIEWERNLVVPRPEYQSIFLQFCPNADKTVLVVLKESVRRRTSLHSIFQGEKEVVPVAGGLDSMILAALLDQCLDPKYEVDLLNVSFDGANAPDRISAKAGIKELKKIAPLRRFNFKNLDDLNIGTALWLAARGDGWIHKERENQTSEARILLVGAGADEQCAGYEMKLDMQRIWKRNLGRDDRRIADNGKEARFPFLDEDVIKTLLDIPLWEIADLEQPSGKGDKKILRQVAKLLGLPEIAKMPKRAIQVKNRFQEILDSNHGCDNIVGDDTWRAEAEIGGNERALQALRELIIFPFRYPLEARTLGLKWSRGLLLYGPPGTGKTSLVRAVVQECDAHLTVLSPHSVHRAHAGESEKVLREAFAEASSHAGSDKPSVIFIDEIDVLCPRRSSRGEQGVRIASQLFTLMDSNKPSSSPPRVVVVASTNRLDAIDPALRRAGRFDTLVEVSTPNEEDRLKILQLYTKKVSVDPTLDLQAIATSCNGFVGADLEALCREATISASKRSSDSLILTSQDFKVAKSVVGPSITRGITVEIPKVTWDDVGGLKDLKKKLQQAVEWPIKHSAAFTKVGISPMRGILLHGPPGCSKTTLAKAAANAAQASFFSLSCAELFSMYVGEGEALLRNTFQRARLASPSIIFFDEADVVACKRGDEGSSNSSTVGERLLSTLLTEMDGLEEAKGILVLAATNRPYAVDAALMRPGRFDLVLYVPPPDVEARLEILQVHTRNMRLGDDVDLRKMAEETELFTGAELEGLCRESGTVSLRENIAASGVFNRHFQTAKKSLKPALTVEEVETYASFRKSKSSDSRTVRVEKKKVNHSNVLGLGLSWKVGVLSLMLVAAGNFYLKQTKHGELAAAT
ncbi:hypothetical protein Bca52824_058938 [Brassica carinata]|uniref:AAA+ ATPase domain-containing protein n=1 Tax=Brassica carinata TaxID=52824 RepID=A0A8X7QTN7_BRACI|nr:hypothetical protein Bca52824_058938 [Brassica carinata]